MDAHVSDNVGGKVRTFKAVCRRTPYVDSVLVVPLLCMRVHMLPNMQTLPRLALPCVPSLQTTAEFPYHLTPRSTLASVNG